VASAKKVLSKPAAMKKATPAKKAVAVKPAKKSPVTKPTKTQAKSAKPVKKAAPVKPVKKAAPVKPVKKAAPVKPVKKAAPVKSVKKAAPVKPVKKAAPVKPTKKAAPAKPTKKAAPAKPVTKAVPAKPVKQTAQVSATVAPEAPARLVMLPSTRPTKRKNGPPLKPLRHIPEPLVVNAGDDPWTKAELNAIKRDLQTDLGRLRVELANAEVEIADLLKDSGDGAGDDQADAGTKTFEREHELSLVNNARDMVLQSERALARIELGTYGVCESCGNPIGKARLQVFPRATLCMVCKQREERR
jgi:DnaK suppressor protein